MPDEIVTKQPAGNSVLAGNLFEALGRELKHISRDRLAVASAEISRCYRDKDLPENRPAWTSDLRKGYLAVRLPATLAVIRAILAELRLRGPDLNVKTMLDLGAGPGTAAWAAVEAYPELARATLIEQDTEMAAVGRRLAAEAGHEALRRAAWRVEDLTGPGVWAPSDLVVVSYVLGELPAPARGQLLDKAWHATAGVLCIAEPGTPRGFSNIAAARDHLLARGAKLLAPCPHEGQCPMKGHDWCHFVQRLPRSVLHRHAKGGKLSYEDEKYSYLIASRVAGKPASARVVKRPMLRSGHVVLDLCVQEELVRRTVPRSEKDRYRASRKAAWGDGWDEG